MVGWGAKRGMGEDVELFRGVRTGSWAQAGCFFLGRESGATTAAGAGSIALDHRLWFPPWGQQMPFLPLSLCEMMQNKAAAAQA